MHTAQETLQEQVRRVAEARRELDQTRRTVIARRTAFDVENADVIKQLAAQMAAADQAESALRALTLAHYGETQEKRPVPGVEVKVKTSLAYEAATAFAWAQQKGLALIPEALDVKAFEKIVGSMVEKPAFVTVKETPQAQIASDLEKVLAAVAA